MKINKYTIGLLLVLTISLIGCVSATSVVLESPTDSESVTGLFILNASIDSNSSNYQNCSWYVKSAGLTANTSWITIGDQVANTTQGFWGTTYNTTNNIEDGSDYIFNVSCTNATNTLSDVSSNVVVDNTVPVAPTSLSPTSESVDDDGSVTFSGTVDGNETTACTLNFPNKNPGSSSYSMTHTGDTCTYTISSLPEETYDYYLTASDGTNTSDSSTLRFGVSIDTPSNYLFTGEENFNVGGYSFGWTQIVIVLVVLVTIIYLVKKK